MCHYLYRCPQWFVLGLWSNHCCVIKTNAIQWQVMLQLSLPRPLTTDNTWDKSQTWHYSSRAFPEFHWGPFDWLSQFREWAREEKRLQLVNVVDYHLTYRKCQNQWLWEHKGILYKVSKQSRYTLFYFSPVLHVLPIIRTISRDMNHSGEESIELPFTQEHPSWTTFLPSPGTVCCLVHNNKYSHIQCA